MRPITMRREVRALIGEALVVWAKGQPARLTPFAQRLLWAEARARTLERYAVVRRERS